MDYKSAEFNKQRVDLDGNSYTACRFIECELVFAASGPVALAENQFLRCRWVFEGAAADTVTFMRGLYHGAGEGGRRLIEETIEDIMRNP